MIKNRMFRLLSVALLACSVLLTAAWSLDGGVAEANAVPLAETGLHPEPVHNATSKDILVRLEHHYRQRKLNDALSAEVLDSYLKSLDPNRLYFTRADIDEFDRWRSMIDDQLARQDLSIGYAIYNRYQMRVQESIGDLLAMLEDGIDELDFTIDEQILLDRSEAPWPADAAEKRQLWRKRLKDAVLSMRLNGDAEEEIGTRLERRYLGQLKRLKQSTSEDVFQAYINALTTRFDPHTNYHTPHNSENFTISMSRSLEGIGAVLQAEEEFTKVVRLVPGGPAAKSGALRPADRIVGVAQADDEMVNVIGWRLDEVVNLIRGPKDSTVRLEIIPSSSVSEHNTRIITIVRNRVVLEDQAASSDIIEVGPKSARRRIGVIDIPTFYLDFEAMHRGDENYTSTTRDVARLIMDMNKQSIDGLVIDLRDNGGGALPEAMQLVSLFIDRGPTVQVRDARGKVSAEAGQFPGQLYSGPLAVLVNRHSASASEIFAGAMQDYGRALIIGDDTFGKGTVQTLLPLGHGQLKMTQAKFYRVSGGSNQHRGVVPDLNFPFLVDKQEIGESALPNALPWDQVRPASFTRSGDLSPWLPILRQRHDKRVADDPEFDYVRRQLALQDTLQERKSLPLHEAHRRQQQAELEKQQLAIENDRRRSRGEKPFKSHAEMREAEEARITLLQSGEQLDEPDPYLIETGNVLADFIELSRNPSSSVALTPAS